jgi:HSP20 family molecular chaperone IbpA
MNRLFDDVFRGYESSPGLEERDVEVLFQEGVLTVRGEKRVEKAPVANL